MRFDRGFMVFALVGVAVNGAGYAAYALASLALTPHQSMTLSFLFALFLGYLLQRRITFRASVAGDASWWRYGALYLALYLLNWGILSVFVSTLQFPHLAVQIVAVIVLASSSYLIQKHWVF